MKGREVPGLSLGSWVARYYATIHDGPVIRWRDHDRENGSEVSASRRAVMVVNAIARSPASVVSLNEMITRAGEIMLLLQSGWTPPLGESVGVADYGE